MKLRTIFNSLLTEALKSSYRNVTHGTSSANAELIKKSGFRLPKRKALFFDSKGSSGNLAGVYGSEIIITVDLNPRKPIEMSEVKSRIFQEMKSKGIVHNEINTHNYLIKLGYDLIDNVNELIVLNPKIITVKNFAKI